MVCQGCYSWSPHRLCRVCLGDLRPAPDRLLAGGTRAIAAFDHTGVAARLVHSLKYRGLELVLGLAVTMLRHRVGGAHVFVPVPRSWTRYVRYGIDPALELACRLADATGGKVVRQLSRPIHSTRRAGADHSRPAGRFHARSGLQGGLIVVDDVLTTGATALEAMTALLPAQTTLVVTATSARRVSSLLVPGVDRRPGARNLPAGDS